VEEMEKVFEDAKHNVKVMKQEQVVKRRVQYAVMDKETEMIEKFEKWIDHMEREYEKLMGY